MVQEVYDMLNSELQMVHKELNQKKIPRPDNLPRLAGQAHWARALKRRLESSVEVRLLGGSVCPM